VGLRQPAGATLEKTRWVWVTKSITPPKNGGKGKEAAGQATGDDRLEAEGRGDQVKADLKQAGEKVKDAFKKD
jgi:uncharacterized protein YjbJ (UPF0337 family)